jgi:hypothetical protein
MLALIMWLFTTWYYTSHANFGLVLTIEALALTLSIYALRVPEIPLLGMSYLRAGAGRMGIPSARGYRAGIRLALAANSAALLVWGCSERTPGCRQALVSQQRSP